MDPLNTKLIADFIFYVDIHSGPDWEEEVETAGKESLKIDYYKWD